MWPEEQKENKYARMQTPEQANSTLMALRSLKNKRSFGSSKVRLTLRKAEDLEAKALHDATYQPSSYVLPRISHVVAVISSVHPECAVYVKKSNKQPSKQKVIGWSLIFFYFFSQKLLNAA